MSESGLFSYFREIIGVSKFFTARLCFKMNITLPKWKHMNYPLVNVYKKTMENHHVSYALGIQSHCDMMIRGSNHTLIMAVTILRR